MVVKVWSAMSWVAPGLVGAYVVWFVVCGEPSVMWDVGLGWRGSAFLCAFAPHPPDPLLPQGEKGELGRPEAHHERRNAGASQTPCLIEIEHGSRFSQRLNLLDNVEHSWE
jgi:hypothetical protein